MADESTAKTTANTDKAAVQDEFPMTLEEYAVRSQARRIIIAGFRASLESDEPRLYKDWDDAYKTYMGATVEN